MADAPTDGAGGTVLVTGATGYIGGRLVPELLDAGRTVRCLVRNPRKLSDAAWRDRVDVVEGDVADAASLDRAMAGVGTAYYLVHSMGGSGSFDEQDRTAAECFRDAAARAGIDRIVYLGGLGRDDDPSLSRHLRSRHEVGRILADGPTPVTELRAALIIGSGSASFEMLRYLVEVLPVMVTPRWVENRCQPIAIRDVLRWLVAAAGDDPAVGPGVVEIGGADVLTYRQMMQTYAEVAGLPRRVIIGVPVLSPQLSSLWVGLVTPLPASLARPLVESLVNEVVVHHPRPGVDGVMTFREAVGLAVQRADELDVATRWSDATLPGRTPADPMPTDPDWAGGSLLVDHQEATSAASPHDLFRTVAGIGGRRGWYVTPLLWAVRGWIDKVVGGVGMRRGRRHPDELWVGDALDFWRVEAIEVDRLLRLRAEMRLPGEAWLEWRIRPGPDGVGSHLVQRAAFYPRGLAGRAYWYALLPFHALIFRQLAERLAEAAEAATGLGPAGSVPAMSDVEGEYEPGAWDWVNQQVQAYEASGGKEAGNLEGTDMPIIVVTTRGAKTGKIRKIGLMRVEHDGEYALVASKGGMPEHPGWYHNLLAYPDDVAIQDGADKFEVHVREVEGDERQQWWDRAVAAYPDYATYQAGTDRRIPVFVATRD